MASRWWAASMLLASLMSLYWMTSAAQPPAPLTADLSPPHRVRRSAGTRENIQASTQVVKDVLTGITEVFQREDVQQVSEIIRGLAKCASLVPGTGGLVSSVLSVVVDVVPRQDPVLKAVTEGFEEVNRKLDSLSNQISDLSTDVEWHNYISIYSQQEQHLLNVWRWFSNLVKTSKFLQHEEDKERLAQTFISLYENTGAETSLINLYRYLTVTHTSLTVNINDLLKRKWKCDVGQIGRYNLYLSSLLWKGMVVNQFYRKLMGFNTTAEEAEHSEMFKKVSEAQISTIESCLNDYESYMKKDVIETTTATYRYSKKTIAAQVKNKLDQKYSWYSWVVLVYHTSNDKNMILYNMIKIPVGSLIVAVDYTLKGVTLRPDIVRQSADTLFKNEECTEMARKSQYTGLFVRMAKLTFTAFDNMYAVTPEPLHKVSCHWETSFWLGTICYISEAFIYYSRTESVCSDRTCKNGTCVRLLNSNEMWCKCRDGYYGNMCEKKMVL